MTVPNFVEALITGELDPPSDEELAMLFLIIGDERAASLRALLWAITFPDATARLERLWKLAIDAGTDKEGSTAILEAIQVEQQLSRLIQSVAKGDEWIDPTDVLDPEDNFEGRVDTASAADSGKGCRWTVRSPWTSARATSPAYGCGREEDYRRRC